MNQPTPNNDIDVKVVDMRDNAFAVIVDNEGACSVRGTCSPRYIVSSLRAVIATFVLANPELADTPPAPFQIKS